jgi:hypothetical protein
MLLASPNSYADYSCSGTVNYLGVGANGDLMISLANSSPIHGICSVGAQGSYVTSVPSCKLIYGAFLAARLAGKIMVVYYHDNGLTCGTLPSWGTVPSVYFVQGPD